MREKDIPGEAGIKLASIALGIDRTPKMQTRSQEVVQETILIFSTDWSIQQLKIDVGYSLLVRFWTVDPEKGSGAEFKKSWIRRDRWVLTGLARTKSGQARRGRRRRMSIADADKQAKQERMQPRRVAQGAMIITSLRYLALMIILGGRRPQSQMSLRRCLVALL